MYVIQSLDRLCGVELELLHALKFADARTNKSPFIQFVIPPRLVNVSSDSREGRLYISTDVFLRGTHEVYSKRSHVLILLLCENMLHSPDFDFRAILHSVHRASRTVDRIGCLHRTAFPMSPYLCA